MANIASAKKKARQAVKHRAHNTSVRTMLRSTVKDVVKAIDAKDKAKAEAAYKIMVPVLDRHATKGLIHKNKAARHKSHLSKKIAALA